MPNHVYNTLEIDEKYSAKLEKLISKDKNYWTGLFQSIHPMPPSLDIKAPQNDDELKKIAKDNLKKYGHKDWYSWRTDDDNWGEQMGEIMKATTMTVCINSIQPGHHQATNSYIG